MSDEEEEEVNVEMEGAGVGDVLVAVGVVKGSIKRLVDEAEPPMIGSVGMSMSIEVFVIPISSASLEKGAGEEGSERSINEPN